MSVLTDCVLLSNYKINIFGSHVTNLLGRCEIKEEFVAFCNMYNICDVHVVN